MHDSSGARVLCGCCVGADSTVQMQSYPGYSGSIAVRYAPRQVFPMALRVPTDEVPCLSFCVL